MLFLKEVMIWNHLRGYCCCWAWAMSLTRIGGVVDADSCYLLPIESLGLCWLKQCCTIRCCWLRTGIVRPIVFELLQVYLILAFSAIWRFPSSLLEFSSALILGVRLTSFSFELNGLTTKSFLPSRLLAYVNRLFFNYVLTYLTTRTELMTGLTPWFPLGELTLCSLSYNLSYIFFKFSLF